MVPIPELTNRKLKDEKEDKLKSSFLTGRRIFYFKIIQDKEMIQKMEKKILFTSECVSPGHPDKISDPVF